MNEAFGQRQRYHAGRRRHSDVSDVALHRFTRCKSGQNSAVGTETYSAGPPLNAMVLPLARRSSRTVSMDAKPICRTKRLHMSAALTGWSAHLRRPTRFAAQSPPGKRESSDATFPEISKLSGKEGWTAFTLFQTPFGRKGFQSQCHDVGALLIVSSIFSFQSSRVHRDLGRVGVDIGAKSR